MYMYSQSMQKKKSDAERKYLHYLQTQTERESEYKALNGSARYVAAYFWVPLGLYKKR